MKYPFFASFVVLCGVVCWNSHKFTKKIQQDKDAFWEKERLANNTRKQPLDDLIYINIPLDTLPVDVHNEDPTVNECIKDIKWLSEEKIVNFTGISNTDLKLKYGVANLPYLQNCDQRFTHLASTLKIWSEKLLELSAETEALKVAEYAISIKADVSSCYYIAAKAYKKNNEIEKIDNLLKIIDELDTPLKKSMYEKVTNIKEA